jgi:hypothetical protein
MTGVGQALSLVADELAVALERFPSFNSAHEGWAVIVEEVSELQEHVFRNTGRSPEAMAEAVQVAAMAIRYIYDLSDG